MSVPALAQPPTTESEAASDADISSVIPEGRDIPLNEAEQLRGGNVRIALVVVQVGRRLVLRVISCTSNSACRNQALRQFGAKAVEWVVGGMAYDVLARQACRRGYSIAC